jgi:hypothetical protein
MLKEIEQLLVLQDRDRKIRTLRQELKHAPLERKALDERVAATQGKFDSSKHKSKEIEVERKRLENEVLSKREQIAKYQTQKFSTRKNEEYAAFNTAIQHLEDDIRKIEDREIELMESTEALLPLVAESDREAQAIKTQAARQHADIDAKVVAINEEIKRLEADRALLAAALDEDLVENYQRLFATKGEAVVSLEHDVCTGCHMKVTASTVSRAKARREVVNCEQCNRIVYWGS